MTHTAPTPSAGPADRRPRKPSALKTVAIFGVAIMLAGGIALIDLHPDLSHLDVSILSGSTKGNYFAIVDALAKAAAPQKGSVANASTHGSGDNIARLNAAADDCSARFGLVQDGMPWGAPTSLQLVARLTVSETVFFVGARANEYTRFSQLNGLSIGIGPEGSGTAALAKRLFESRGLNGLKARLTHHGIADQMRMVKAGDLDLGMFVIANDASLIDDAVLEHGMQIASFEHTAAAAHHLPFLTASKLNAGYYDPVASVPKHDKDVLRVDTLLVGNGCASRSETMAILSLVALHFPGTIIHNTTTPNTTGLPMNRFAQAFFNNQGPEVLDQYAPWLVDYVPIGNLTWMVMALSILFNVMGFGNRFRLWRIDADRVKLEGVLPEIFGANVIVAEIVALNINSEHRAPDKITRLRALITQLEALKERCRNHSVSMLVPMGQEMGYRYQESLIDERLAALRVFRGRLVEQP